MSIKKYQDARIANLQAQTRELKQTIAELEKNHNPYGLSDSEMNVTPTSDEEFIERIKPRMLRGRI